MKTYIFKTKDEKGEVTLTEDIGKKKVDMLRNKHKMIIDDSSQTVYVITPFSSVSQLIKEIEY